MSVQPFTAVMLRRLHGVWLVSVLFASAVMGSERPNLLWLSCEDISPHLGCYGDALATTPNLDAFARQSTLFERAFTTAGVCAPSRSAIITGMYQTTIGTHHMRCKATLPDHVKPFTFWLREAGYYCTNNRKQDYQFSTPQGSWDESSREAHWKNRPNADQPFFAVFNFQGCHESGIANDDKYQSVTRGIERHDRATVAKTLPPYYPDTPVSREDWGRYYDVITAMDRWVGEHLEALDEAGLAENTIVVFWSDHGAGLPRAKRWLYGSGTRVPFIVRVPDRWQSYVGAGFDPGTRSQRLISMIDLGPTMLSLAGLSIPGHMQGRAAMGPQRSEPRDYVFGARDRMDERYDVIRMVHDGDFQYIRNYEPYKPWYQFINTAERGRIMQEIRSSASTGPSPPVAGFLADRKPIEELYDVASDPHQIHNLAADPNYASQLSELREQHRRWVVETRDLGLIPEAEITRLKTQAGSEWAILNSDASDERMQTIRDVALVAGGDSVDDISRLRRWLQHDDTVVRYWAAVGIGNRVSHQPGLMETSELLRMIEREESESTRIALARIGALMRSDDTNSAANGTATYDCEQVIASILDGGSQWARLHAALVLDELDDAARPVIATMRRNKAYRDGMVARGKYTVRVLNKALNDLDGTNHLVP